MLKIIETKPKSTWGNNLILLNFIQQTYSNEILALRNKGTYLWDVYTIKMCQCILNTSFLFSWCHFMHLAFYSMWDNWIKHYTKDSNKMTPYAWSYFPRVHYTLPTVL